MYGVAKCLDGAWGKVLTGTWVPVGRVFALRVMDKKSGGVR